MSDDKKLHDQTNSSPDANPDPITGQPGAHPVGTGIGAAGAGAVGAVVGGLVGGPIGAAVGTVIGAVAGGLAGKSAAERVNPSVEDEYWRNNYATRPYVEKERSYEDYQPAYRTGYEGYSQYGDMGKTYDEVEPDLRSEYEKQQGGAGLAWDKAKHATKDAWERLENTLPGKDNDRNDRSVTSREGVIDDNLDRSNQNLGTSITNDAATVRLYEERLIADKHREKVGEVTVGKRIETETAQASVPIEKERVVIERVEPVDAEAVVAPEDVQFGDAEAARMEVYEETPEIQKQAFVREEVNVRKVVDRDLVNAEEQLRRERLDIDMAGNPVMDDQSLDPTVTRADRELRS
jgi:uncharacterized protein (TIGR02271 family)